MLGNPAFSIPTPAAFDQLISLHGRVAVVTGGSRGIGAAIVWRLAQAGAAVIATARGKKALDEIEAKIAATGATAIGVQADASSIEDAQRVIDMAVSRFGRLDIVVNNAAVFRGSLTIETRETLWDQTLDTDLKGAFFIGKFAALKMIEGGHGGRIINILSTEIVVQLLNQIRKSSVFFPGKSGADRAPYRARAF